MLKACHVLARETGRTMANWTVSSHIKSTGPAVHASSTMTEPIPQALTESLTRLKNPMQACGSGGTTAGLALGNHLSGMGATVHAYGVCDDEEYFYDFIDGLYQLLGATPDRIGRLAGLP